MAMCKRFACSNCGKTIEVWDDGNPYYLDEKGEKQYAYHPNHDLLAKCIGNDSPHLCLACGKDFMVDSKVPITQCPACNASSIVDQWQLENCACPFCKQGQFHAEPGIFAIS